jgi:hypothetical protein
VNWSTFLAALAGGAFALAGAVVGQLMTKRREFELDEKRAARVRADEVAERRRQVILSAAEYAQSYETRVSDLEDEYASTNSSRPDVVHRDLLTARVRTLGDPLMMTTWSALIVTELWVDSEMAYGNFEVTRGTDKAWLSRNAFYMRAAHAAVEAVMYAATSSLGEDHDNDETARFATSALLLSNEVTDAFQQVQQAERVERSQEERDAALRLAQALQIAQRAVTHPTEPRPSVEGLRASITHALEG